MSKFLENLKNSLEKGEFNSDIAKKMNEINELADKKIEEGMTTNDLEESLLKKAKEGGIKSVNEEEAVEINQEYEKKLAEIKLVDAYNKEEALLIDIEDAVQATIEDLFDYIKSVKDRHVKAMLENDPLISGLNERIITIENKYKSIIN